MLVGPAVALGLPLLDTSLTISRRLLSGRPLMQGDGDHVHHRLRGRFGTRRAVFLLYAVCAVFSGLALLMLLGGRTHSRLGLGLAVVFAGGWAMGWAICVADPAGCGRRCADEPRRRPCCPRSAVPVSGPRRHKT